MEILSLSCTSAAFGSLSEELLHLGKSLRFRARGASMQPLVRSGDILLVKSVDPQRVRIGDVVLCSQGQDRILVHRVIGKRSTTDGHRFLVQGDQSPQADGWLAQHQVLGRLVAVERDGKPFELDGLRMRSLSCFAVLRSRWHLGQNKYSNFFVRIAKKLPIFSTLFN